MSKLANDKQYKGYNGTLVITKTGVIIQRGLKGFLLGGGMLRGDKTIPFSSIVAVQLKNPGLTAGYLQLTLKGGSEAKAGLFQSTRDENTINFHGNKKKFQEAKNLIEERIGGDRVGSVSNLDELEKLAKLKEKGIVTQQEFEAKKKSLLS